MNLSRLFKNISIVTAALIAVSGISINLFREDFLPTNAGNRFFWVVLFGLLLFFIHKAAGVKEKPVVKYALIAAVFVAGIETAGYGFWSENGFGLLYSTPGHFLKSALVFLGIGVTVYCGCALLFRRLADRPLRDETPETGILFSARKKSLFALWLIIFVLWLPYFIMLFPGVLSYDSLTQVYQALGLDPLDNTQPVFQTFIIGICMKIGGIFGNNNAGIAIYSLVQMAIMSGIFSFTIFYMAKRNVHRYVRICAFLFFALFPVNPLYGVTMWKDILFAGALLLFTIFTIEAVTNSERFLSRRRNFLLFVLAAIFLILAKNNGLYVAIISLVVFILCTKNYRKKLALALGIVIVFHLVFTGPVFALLDIEKGSVGAPFSVPLQQFARIVKYRGSDLTTQEKEVIHGFLPHEQLGDVYDPRFADPVLTYFDNEYYQENKLSLYTTTAKLFFKFPKESFEAFLSNSFGYWYPETIATDINTEIRENPIGIERQSILTDAAYNAVKNTGYSNRRDIPVLSMIYSIGFFTVLLLLSLLLFCAKRRYRYILTFVPVLTLLLTISASPLYASYRYAYGLIVCLPLLLAFSLKTSKTSTKLFYEAGRLKE